MPVYGVWLSLFGLIAVGLLGSWILAAGLLMLLLRQLARPFDFLTSFLIVTVGASFIRNEGGHLTLELSLLSGLILFMLISYVVSNPGRWLALPRTPLLVPLLAYVGLTIANFARGALTGLSLKFAGLELLPVMALGSSLLVANGIDPRRDLRVATVVLIAMAYGNAALGYYFFAAFHQRTGGVYFMPMPGMIAVLAVNLALRAPRRLGALGWILASLPLFGHQLISFTRGYWLGCLAGLLTSFVTYTRWGRGSGGRLRRASFVSVILFAGGLAAALALGLLLGQSDLLTLAGSRFGTITATGLTPETGANVARLVEYATVLHHIATSPWFGHGLGFAYTFREPLGFAVVEQWYSHEIYLFVTLKQGLVGLAIFVWMVWSAAVLGIREAGRHDDVWESSWLAAAGACTVFMAVLDLSNFHFCMVNGTFPLALLWGATMAIGRQGSVRFHWSRPEGHALPVPQVP